MTRLRGGSYDITAELNELKKDDEKTKNENVNTFEALGRKVGLKSLFIGLGLMLFQQLSGINAVIFYSGSIFAVSIYKCGVTPDTITNFFSTGC